MPYCSTFLLPSQHGGHFSHAAALPSFRNMNPRQARQRMQPGGEKEVSVTQARGQLNSICFNSRLLAGMLVLCIYKGFQSCQKSSSVVKIKAWIFNSFRLYKWCKAAKAWYHTALIITLKVL